MAAIIHSQVTTGGYRILKNPVISSDPAGFDTASMEVLFRGTQAQLDTAFALGALNMPSAPGGSKMYCLGPLGATQARFGHIWAAVGWKGFKNGEKAIVESFTATSEETIYPFTEGATTYVFKPSSKSSTINPATGRPWRSRVTKLIPGLQQSGVNIGAPSQPFVPAKPTATVPNALRQLGKEFGTNIPDSADPLISDPYGWVPRNFQITSEFTAGAVCLRFWTAQYEWVDQVSP